MPISIASAAIACCILASPAKPELSTSTPYFLKKACSAPISTGRNEKASACALPTRSLCCAEAGAAGSRSDAAASATAAKRKVENARFIPVSPLIWPHSFCRRQEFFGVELRHVGLLRKRVHIDEGLRQHGETFRIEAAVLREHRQGLVIDLADDGLRNLQDAARDTHHIRLVVLEKRDRLEPGGEEFLHVVGMLRDHVVAREDYVIDVFLHDIAEL